MYPANTHLHPILKGNMAIHQLEAMELKRKIETMIGLSSISWNRDAARGSNNNIRLWIDGRITMYDDWGRSQEIAPGINDDHQLLPEMWMPKIPSKLWNAGGTVRTIDGDKKALFILLKHLEQAIEVHEHMLELTDMVQEILAE